jgi:serine/threonine protein kinase/tetratricopeptide (TPR) repeat protein
MNSEQGTVEKLFHEALDFTSPGERAAFLKGACGDNLEVRRKVEALLNAHEHGGIFLDQPPTGISAKTIAVAETLAQLGEGAGDRIGRYRLLELIGEGGFGSVYMAEQQEPVRRRVALKIIKLGMDTREIVARFEVERQALALMDHPNIAQVLDGGATPNGRPYFVMELIKGFPITEFCDSQELPTEERLKLFCRVCHAVQHAHQKGVIHRDLKPSNILVTELDGEAVPKIIDFGVAKAMGSPLTEKTLFTRFEQMIGTPAYMSPEQTGLGSLDLDTRTDIYSLGVLLYELLTGTTPLERKTFARVAFDEIRRLIKETQPPRPSTRLKTMGKQLEEVARTRRTEPKKLQGLVCGDLDWIVMKSLEKDRKRRYGAASELADDLQRYLDHKPIVARPPSKAYTFQKFVRRNGFVVAGVSIVLASVVLGSAVATWKYFAERKARARAEASSQFLKDMLNGVAPGVALGQNTDLLRGILDKTAERLDIDLKELPEVEAELAATIAKVYFELGDFGSAEKMMKRSADLLKASLGEKDPGYAQALANLGVVFRLQGKLSEAEKIQREILELRRKTFGHLHENVAESYQHLGTVLDAQGRRSEAEDAYRRALEIVRKIGKQEELEFILLNNLASTLADEDKLTEAETYYRQIVSTYTKIFTNETPALATSLNNLAFVLTVQKKSSEAEEVYRRALNLQEKLLPPGHRDIAQTLNNLATLLRDEQKLTEAETLCRRALEIRMKLPGDNEAEISQSLHNLAFVLADERKYAEAEDLLRKCLEIRERVLPDNWKTFAARSDLGACLVEQKKYADAEPLLVSGYEGMKRRLDVIPADNRSAMEAALEKLVKVCEATARPEKAAGWSKELESLKQSRKEKGTK